MKHRVVLVTGASSGIGAACALRLARAGHRVVAVSRSGTVPATHTSARLTARTLDIRDAAAVDRTVHDLAREFGGLDAVVNSAGIAVAGALEDLPLDLVHAQLETNFIGAVYLIRAAAPLLRRSAPSRFIHISSIAAHVALPYQSLYCAAHFAMAGLLQSLRYELAPQGVRLMLVEPGSVRTGITKSRRFSLSSGVYRRAAAAALGANDADELGGVEPDSVAAVVERMLTMPAPPDRRSVGHLRERVGVPARRFLPSRLMARIVGAHYKL